MANPEHLQVLKQGVEEWNKWRDEHPDVIPDLENGGVFVPEFEHRQDLAAGRSGPQEGLRTKVARFPMPRQSLFFIGLG